MFNVGSGEFLVIFLIALIVLGPDKLPQAAKQAGKVMGDLRKLSQGFQNEMRQAMDLEGLQPNAGPTLPPVAAETEPSTTPASTTPASATTDSTPAAGDAQPAAPTPAPTPAPIEITASAPAPPLKSVPTDPARSNGGAEGDGRQGAA
jgi:sec-independent protein translocase protein TatB